MIKKLPKLSKKELIAFEQAGRNGIVRKYVKWGKPRNVQIAMLLHYLSNKMMLEGGPAISRKNKKKQLIYT